MKYNLLQPQYDKVCDRFTNGLITYAELQIYETYFITHSKLFTVWGN